MFDVIEVEYKEEVCGRDSTFQLWEEVCGGGQEEHTFEFEEVCGGRGQSG